MNRRDLIGLLGSTAAAWPLGARAQQPERVRRIGVLSILAPDDPEAQVRNTVLEKTLHELGWQIGRDLQIDYRLAGGEDDRLRQYAAELVSLAPDVILTVGSPTITPVQRATRTIPIVFVNVADPVGSGFVQSLARPGGNATGFLNFEYSISGKWLDLLKQVAPRMTRVAVLRDPTTASGIGQYGAIQVVAQSLGVELSPFGVRDLDEIDRNLMTFAHTDNGGLIATAGGLAAHRKRIIELASRHKLPAIYPFRYYATDGGMISYGPDTHDPIRRAAEYVDRILRGEKPVPNSIRMPSNTSCVPLAWTA